MSRRVVIVGGGVGGLAAAIRLRGDGHDVTIFERNDRVGGKLATFERDGFRFDIGPSLLTLPHFLDEVFRVAGTTLAEQVDLVRLDPQFRYNWRDGTRLVVHDDNDATAASFEAFAGGAGAQWRSFDTHGKKIWDVAERTFFAGPMSNPLSLVKRMASPRDLAAIDPLRTLDRRAGLLFDHRRLQQWAGRYATYSGSSPYRAPATLACIPHIEARFGCWYVIGGLGRLRDAFERVARALGVEIVTGTAVRTIGATADRVTGVVLADGETVAADIVVANVDAEHLYADLLPDATALKRLHRTERSTSGFVLCAAVRGTTPGIEHHNVWFPESARREFADLEAGRIADDPTIFAAVSSVTDPTQAPARSENWFVLINTPPDVDIDAHEYTETALRALSSHGVRLRHRLAFTEAMTPRDIEERYRSPGGAIYGTSSNGRRAAFRRPANRGPRSGLYLVGGSSHPGGGVPLVATSAKIVAEMIGRDIA